MADDNKVSIDIIADASGVAPGVAAASAGIEEMGAVAKGTSEQMSAAFLGVSASLKEIAVSTKETAEVMIELREAVMGFAEVMIAAFAIEAIVDFAKEMGEAAEKTEHLGEIFGMTTPQVQGLQAAATLGGLGIDTLTRAMGMLDKNLAGASGGTGKAAEAFKALGITAIEGKSQMELLLAIADKFHGMEDGPNKVALAMGALGRAGKEMIPFLNKGSEGLKEANAAAQAYSAGLIEGMPAKKELVDWLKEANEKGMALAESNNTQSVAMQGVSNVMTDAFAPAFTDASNAINEMIKAFIDSYREGGIVAVILNTIAGVCDVVFEAFKAVGEIIGALWDVVKSVFEPIGELITKVFGKNVPNAGNTTKGVFNDIIDIIEIMAQVFIVECATIEGVVKSYAQAVIGAWQSVYDVLSGQGLAKARDDWKLAMAEMDRIGVDTANKVKAAWEKAHAAMVALNKDKKIGGDSKPADNVVKKPPPSMGHNAKKEKKEKKDPADKDNSAQTDLEEAKSNAQKTEQIAADSARTQLELSKLATSEQLRVIQNAEKAGTISKQEAANQKVLIIAQEVKDEITAVDAIYQAKVDELNAEDAAEVKALKAKQARYKAGTDEYTNLQNQIEAITQKSFNALEVLAAEHESRLKVINAKGINERVKAAEISAKKQKTYLDTLAKGFSDDIAKMLTAQQSFMSTVNNMWQSMLGVAQKAISKMLAQWITSLAAKDAATRVSHQKQILSDAKEAASGAYKAVAGIPIVGPVLAPIAAAAAFAGVEAFSAAGGWGDVPFDGAATTLHKNEMVLPANLATPLRSMLSGGANDNSGVQTKGGDNVHLHLHGDLIHNPRQLESWFRQNNAAVSAGVKQYHRSGGR
jgi:hypothetical protein